MILGLHSGVMDAPSPTERHDMSQLSLVSFPDEFTVRAPVFFNHFCIESTGEWISLYELCEFVVARFNVSIRPATDTEVARAEELAALYELGQQLGAKMDAILDRHPPSQAEETKAAAKAAWYGLRDVHIPIPSILDVVGA